MTTLDAPLSPALDLRCQGCGAGYELGPTHVCVACFGPLEVRYDPDRLARASRARIAAGPRSLWRYVDLLPVGHDPATRVELGAGMTPLVRADALAARLGLRALWVKDERTNPTHSFKDRVVTLAATAARGFGFTVLACASTGNLANAVAAAAARTGLRSVILVPADLEAPKILTTAVYGATLLAVEGSYDDCNRLCAELVGEYPWAFVNTNVRPFYAEGSKTVGFEIAEQLGWRLPQQVVVPVASGSLLTKVDQAWRELAAAGLVEDAPYRVFGAQADGCSPVATAFRAGTDEITPVRPATIARSLAIGNPADGANAAAVARRTGGAVTSVSDEAVVDGIRLLATTEGIFGETAGGVTVGVLARLLADGLLDPDAETVLLNTGDGLKTLDAVAGAVGPAATIRPTLAAFEAALA